MTKSQPPSTSALCFGPLELPRSVATRHFLFAGTTGSGKTTLLRLLEQSALREIGVEPDCRAIVNDAKLDVIPQLKAMAPQAKIVATNPFDARSTAWDLAADLDEMQVIIEFGYSLIPHLPESQPFFTDAARHLVIGVVTSFMLSGVNWTLADLIRVMLSVRHLKAILKCHPETRDLIALYLRERRLAANILSTVATKLVPFGPVAAAWEHARSRKSLSEWARSPMIWVLGNSEISRVPIQTLNRCMFKRACDLTLSESESSTRRNWFIIDELSDSGKLDGLVSLAKKGRSKGACLAIAFQSVAGLRDSQLYGPYFTEEILAQFGHKFIGRVECASSADWASLLVGDQEIEQESVSKTTSPQGRSTTRNQNTVVRRSMLPSQFMDFAPCDLRNGLTGVFFVPGVGVFQDTLPGEKLFHQQLIPPAANVLAFVRRPRDDQRLRPWTPERAALFGIQEQQKTERPQREDKTQDRPRENLDDLFQ